MSDCVMKQVTLCVCLTKKKRKEKKVNQHQDDAGVNELHGNDALR